MIIEIDKIKIKKRLRKELGNITELKESMRRYGLLNPIIITKDNYLIAGYRRLKAAQALGWDEIECKIIDVNNRRILFEIEAEENLNRKDFTISELEKLEEKRSAFESSGIKKIVYWISSFFRWIYHIFIQ